MHALAYLNTGKVFNLLEIYISRIRQRLNKLIKFILISSLNIFLSVHKHFCLRCRRNRKKWLSNTNEDSNKESIVLSTCNMHQTLSYWCGSPWDKWLYSALMYSSSSGPSQLLRPCSLFRNGCRIGDLKLRKQKRPL